MVPVLALETRLSCYMEWHFNCETQRNHFTDFDDSETFEGCALVITFMALTIADVATSDVLSSI